MPINWKTFPVRDQGVLLMFSQLGGGFQDVELGGGPEEGVMGLDGIQKVAGQPSKVRSLLTEADGGRAPQGGMPFIGLPGQELSQDRPGGDGCQKITPGSRADPARGVKTTFRVIESGLHEVVEADGTGLADLPLKFLAKGGVQDLGMILKAGRGGKIDARPP